MEAVVAADAAREAEAIGRWVDVVDVIAVGEAGVQGVALASRTVDRLDQRCRYSCRRLTALNESPGFSGTRTTRLGAGKDRRVKLRLSRIHCLTRCREYAVDFCPW